MTAQFLAQIDWQRPWLRDFYPIIAPALVHDDWRMLFNSMAFEHNLRNHNGLPISFVNQEALPKGIPYELFISETGKVPTRENLHDFFNAMIWLRFPLIKTQLNALQAEELKKTDPASIISSSVRGKIRDGVTIFDENAALLISDNTHLIQAIREHRWTDVFISERESFHKRCQIHLFGHALIEKLVHPYKSITAHVWVLPLNPIFFSTSLKDTACIIDARIKTQLMRGIQTSDFMPLPLAGIPGWWEDQNKAFYEDSAVFRPKLAKKRKMKIK